MPNDSDQVQRGTNGACGYCRPLLSSGLPDQVSWDPFVSQKTSKVCPWTAPRPGRVQVADLGEVDTPERTVSPNQDYNVSHASVHIHQHRFTALANQIIPQEYEFISMDRNGHHLERKDFGHVELCPTTLAPRRPGCPGHMHPLGVALRVRWLWLLKTDPSRAWTSLPCMLDILTTMLFEASVELRLGNGESFLF
jgi:hypothetical protein